MKHFFLVLLLVLVAKSTETHNQVNNFVRGSMVVNYTIYDALQREALVTLYEATNGEDWFFKNDWLDDDVHYCNWQRMFCDFNNFGDNDGTFFLSLARNNLVGTLPAEFFTLLAEARNFIPSEFYEPRFLRFAYNSLSGSIPTEIGSVLSEEIELQNNTLIGSIPTEIGQSSTLDELRLSNNQLVGNIPSELGLVQLDTLELHDNQLAGTIPTELFDTNNRFSRTLFLNNNSLIGSIPTEIGNLKTIRSLDMSHNILSDEIPIEFGFIGNPPYSIDISFNELSGTFPSELGRLSGISEFYINNNNLGGSLPEEFGQLSQVDSTPSFFPASVILDVSDNNFFGQPPKMKRVIGEGSSYTFSMIADNNEFSGRLSETYCSEREDSDDDEILSFIGSQFDCPLPFCCDDPGNNCGDPCIENNDDNDDEGDDDDEDDNVSSGNYRHSCCRLLALFVAFGLFLFGF